MAQAIPMSPDTDDILIALDDPDCRAIIEHLNEPATAKELSSALDIPQSTLYRKLNLLADASLVEKQVELRTDNPHRKRYLRTFEGVRIGIDDDGSLDITITHREPAPDERLSEMWSEVQKQL